MSTGGLGRGGWGMDSARPLLRCLLGRECWEQALPYARMSHVVRAPRMASQCYGTRGALR